MVRILLIAALLLASLLAFAAPPYDVDVTLTEPADGGPVDSYTLYMNDAEVGQVSPGANSFPGLITEDGPYVFEVEARNGAGATLSDPVTVNVTDVEAPGKPTIQIQVQCDPCVLSISP